MEVVEKTATNVIGKATEKVSDLKNNMTETIEHHSQKMNESIDDVKSKLMTFSTQINEYLSKVDAKVETYKFSVEKVSNGLTVDIAFRATVQVKKETTHATAT